MRLIPEGCVVALLQGNKEVIRRVVARNTMLDEQTVLPRQEARDSEVDADGVVLNIHAGAGPDVIVGKLRDERIGRFIEVGVLKLNIAQARSLTIGRAEHIAIVLIAGSFVVGTLQEER